MGRERERGKEGRIEERRERRERETKGERERKRERRGNDSSP